jgi:uncharacterized membrane protein YidH (DUF202 family)
MLPFLTAWIVTGTGIGVLVGAVTAFGNGFDSFRDTALLELALLYTYGLGLAIPGAALACLLALVPPLRRWCDRRSWQDLGFASAIALFCLAYALRWFELELAYPDLYPFVRSVHSMSVVAFLFLSVGTILAVLAAWGLERLAAALRRQRSLPRVRALVFVQGVLLVATATATSLRPLRSGRELPAEPTPRILPSAVARPHVALIGCDGADWDVLEPLLARGELPILSGLIERGTRATLRTVRRHPSPAIWTTIATGKRPSEHGIQEFFVVRITGMKTPVRIFPRYLALNYGIPMRRVLGSHIVHVDHVNSGMVRVQRVWDLLAAQGLDVSVLGWLVTWPTEEDDAGIHVSNRTFASALRAREQQRRLTVDDEGPGMPLWRGPGLDSLIAAIAADPAALSSEDVFTGEICKRTLDRGQPDFLAAYFREVDASEHLYWKYYEPEYFFRVDEEERREFGPRIEDTYRIFDRILGEILERLDEETIVFVISDHGHGPWYTWLGRGTPGGHTNSRDGILVAAGPGIRHLDLNEGELPSCADLTPTILHLCGLPVATDMDGRVLYEIFSDDSPGSLPARTIASYEIPDGDDWEVLTGEGDEELFERLQALGYIR